MTGNRTIIGVMAVLIVALTIAAALGSSSKKSPPKSFAAAGGFRAVVVPTDRPRTVVVPPCNAPGTGAAVDTPGATALRLPAGSGMRTVLVPQCAAAEGTQANGTTDTASAAFILKPDQQVSTGAHLVVPTQSAVKTIVVSPCPAGVTGPQRETVLTPRAGIAVAPPC